MYADLKHLKILIFSFKMSKMVFWGQCQDIVPLSPQEPNSKFERYQTNSQAEFLAIDIGFKNNVAQ